MARFARSVLSLFTNPGDFLASRNSGQRDDRVPKQLLAAVSYNELLIAIDACRVIWRPSRAGDETAGPIVRVPTIGSWTWSTRKDAKARVAAKYPDLDEKACARAAKLIEWQIGKHNLREFRRGAAEDQDYREHERFWRGHNV
ncbi:hypothetical protein RA27_15105 [Ruegeria sp. ANG-R]|nr:hypothetical protein RA27_15105 [Ruegeria sp. ANG-R]